MRSGESEDVVRRLRSALATMPRVAAGYVFGSAASGRARADSDIDVALLLDPPPRPDERARLVRELVADLGREVRADLVDLVLLDDAPPALAFQVLRHGVLLTCRDEVRLHRFKVATYRRHADREPTERMFREATRRRAKSEVSGG